MIFLLPHSELKQQDFWCDTHQCSKSSYWPNLPACPKCEGEEIARSVLKKFEQALAKSLKGK